MGVGSFGGFNAGAAYVATRGMRGGYGGGSSDNNNEGHKINWAWFSLNALLIGFVFFFFIFVKSDFTNYTRVGTLISKYQTKYKHKSSYYTVSYFTIKWNDREKEVEMFDVTEDTYSNCKLKENVYFKRLKPEYEWMNKGSGLALVMAILIMWAISGILALTKEE